MRCGPWHNNNNVLSVKTVSSKVIMQFAVQRWWQQKNTSFTQLNLNCISLKVEVSKLNFHCFAGCFSLFGTMQITRHCCFQHLLENWYKEMNQMRADLKHAIKSVAKMQNVVSDKPPHVLLLLLLNFVMTHVTSGWQFSQQSLPQDPQLFWFKWMFRCWRIWSPDRGPFLVLWLENKQQPPLLFLIIWSGHECSLPRAQSRDCGRQAVLPIDGRQQQVT